MRNNKWMSLFIALVFIIITLTACSGNKTNHNHINQEEIVHSEEEATTPSGENQPVVYDEEKPVELVFYTNSGDTEATFNQSFGDALRLRFPHFTIKYVSGMDLPSMMASGTKFDIYYHSIGNYERFIQEFDLQFDMRELIQKYDIDLTGLEPSLLDYMNNSMEGQIYGFPIQNSVMVLYYNKAIFEKFGVDFPTDGMTWEEAIALGNKISRQEDGKQYVGLSINPNNTIKQNQLSLPTVDRTTLTPMFNELDEWRKIYETLFLQPAQDAGVRDEINRINKVPDHYTFVTDQTLAMYAYSSGLIPIWADSNLKNIDWDIVSLPEFADLPGIGPQPYPFFMGVTSLSENPDAAIQVLNYMISPEYQKVKSQAGVMPTLTASEVQDVFGSATSFKDKHLSAIFRNQMAAVADQIPPYSAIVADIFAKDVVPLVQGKVDLNTSLRNSEELALQQIKELQR